MAKHTHTGHCQLCGRVQAVSKRSGFPQGIIAKHGYTVDGYFSGVCSGAEHAPLQISRTYADAMITWMTDEAKGHDKTVAKIIAGTWHPAKVESRTGGEYYSTVEMIDNPNYVKYARFYIPRQIPKMVDWNEANEISQKKGLEAARHHNESKAKQLRSMAKDLKALADKIHGTSLIPVEPVLEAEVKAGVKFSRWGFMWEVLSTDYKVAHGCGPYRNGKSLLHAQVKKLDGSDKTSWWLVSDVKRILTKAMKEAS